MTGRLAGAVPALLRDRPFRRYWCAQTISMFGDQVSAIALPLTGVLVLRAGPAQMGLLTALIWLPYLLFGLHAGAWVDGRGHRRVTMIAADLGRFGLLAVIPVSYALGMLALWQLYAVAFGLGTFGVLFQVSDPALFVALLGPGQYVTGNSLVYGSRAFSFVAGPSLGGILVQALSAPFALLADAISFLGSAFFLARVRPAEPPPDRPGKGALAAGARFMLREPVVRASLASAATINLFNFMFFALFLLYATRALHVRPGVLGLVLGAGAIGGVLGSVAARRIEAAVGVGWAYVIGCVMFPLPLMLVPLAAGPAPLVLGMLFAAEFLSGFGVMVLDISIGAMFAVAIPDRVRSRVTGAFQAVNYGTRPLGSLAGGALGSLIGLRPALWVATAGGVLAAGWLVPSPVPGFRMPAAGIADDGARD
ncbi:MAG: MFS transporter [Actinobacteria bacterium]|nr:MFS transporter [Actinomycetota bacterium]MBO0788560.1 MFS transporter [Actinomycetota bacterium]